MTTTPEPMVTGSAPPTVHAAERRLHPMSWLFVLLAQLRQFVVPLVALLVFGRGDRNELWPLIGVGVLVLAAVWQYFTFRYGVAGDALLVRKGLLERSVRVIPFARIHNVALQQSLLHRLFGVAEVRLESAGGKKPEAEMRVLKLDDALALEQLVRHRGQASAVDEVGAPSTPAVPEATTLLQLPLGEVVRHGLVSNRGLIVVGAGVAGLSQISPRLLPNLFERWGEVLFGYAGSHDFGIAGYALAAASLAVLAVALLRLLSVLLSLLQYYGFTLRESGRRLTVERGLLARWRTSASRRRIQAWTLYEGLTHRLLRRRSLHVDTAVAEEQQQQRALRELAPIATPQACDRLIAHLLPKADWAGQAWRPIPVHNWWRLFLPGMPWILVVGGVAGWRFGAWGLLAVPWLAWSAYAARQHARRAAYAVNDQLVAVRGGWWSRWWRFAEIDKLQAVSLSVSPLDRRCGTATLWLDTAGATPMGPSLRIRFLPTDEARALHDTLAATLSRRPLRW
ncbi:PH domain-containing protein [Aerolutibacter ruishenii]|nr:PH domain-containing protein [Lysobacter ruishenii]